ncbi:MAG: IS481 family transposase, partial [Actinomycetota bacterium]|nr:IS481 family transposase [Actinomycetota bacterium]
MSLAELVVTSVLVEGRSKSEVARDYKISRYWVQQLVARYEQEGSAAFTPRSRRPHGNPREVSVEVEDRIVRLRKELSKKGWDAGAETIRVHLQREAIDSLPAVSTIWRILTRRGFVTPQPRKRPKGAGTRFEAAMPNERWQADATHWQLADGSSVEILNLIDDHSRVNLVSDARRTVTGPDVLASFRRAFRQHGIPARVLTDNGAIFTGKPRRGGRVALEIELDLLGVGFDHSRPYHPQTCGKVERFHQTQKKWLAAQPPATTLHELQTQLDRFRRYYNTIRPHRAIARRTPTEAYQARPKAHPAGPRIAHHYRVRHDHVDYSGVFTVRYDSQLRHIGIGRAHRGQRIIALIADRYIRVIHA